MGRTRILAAGIPQVLTDIAVDSFDSDMELVGTIPDHTGLAREVEAQQPDLVLLGLDDAELPVEAARLLDVHPRLKILGVVKGGRMFYWFEAGGVRTALGQASGKELVDVIRHRGGPG